MSKFQVRYTVGVRAANAEKKKEILKVSVRTLVDDAKRKSNMLEERNGLLVF